MKVKLIQVTNFGRKEFKPINDASRLIAEWIGKKHLSKKDLLFMEKVGFDVLIIEDLEDLT